MDFEAVIDSGSDLIEADITVLSYSFCVGIFFTINAVKSYGKAGQNELSSVYIVTLSLINIKRFSVACLIQACLII